MGSLSETCCPQPKTNPQLSSIHHHQSCQQPTQQIIHSDTKMRPKSERRPLELKDFLQLKEIGKGAFGNVYLVKLRTEQKCYAMKVMKKEELKKNNLLNNILLERNILLESNHNFIVRLKYSFQNSIFLYMVMEFIQGGDLYYYLKKEKSFSDEVARIIFAETLLAIQFLHSQRIIYRDLKPENVLVCPDGHIKLADFGLSKQVRMNELTKTFAGTSEYLAPEVVKKKSYGPNVDLWELGIFLYEMLKGQPPFTDSSGRNNEKIHEQILKGRITFTPSFSLDARDIIIKLLKTDPSQRLGSKSMDHVKTHPYLADIDWNALNRKEIESPFLPIVKKYLEQKKRGGRPIKEVEENVPAENITVTGFDYTDPNSYTYTPTN